MSDVIYRHWRPGDDDGVLRILEPKGWCTAETYRAKFDDAGLRPRDVLIAERDGVVVGHLMLPHRRLRDGDATLRFGGVGMVVVDPETRGQGIGITLLRAALAHHRAAGNALVGLFTLPSLVPAYAIYQRLGFVPIAHRVALRVPCARLRAAAGDLTARPAREEDRPALRRLLDDWSRQHTVVSLEADDAPLAEQQVVVRPDGALVGRVRLEERDGRRQVRSGLLAAPEVAVAAVMGAALVGEQGDQIDVYTNAENRVYAELITLAGPRPWPEERDGFVLKLTCLSLARVLAGLSVEIAARLRAANAAPVRVTLALAGNPERIGLEWDGQVLCILDAFLESAAVELPMASLVTGLAGHAVEPPAPVLTDLWAALCPPRRTEMQLVNCW